MAAPTLPPAPLSLNALLRHSLSGDPRVVRAAEAALQARHHNPGFLTALFDLCAPPCRPAPAAAPIALAAAVYLKNLVRTSWHHHPASVSGSGSDSVASSATVFPATLASAHYSFSASHQAPPCATALPATSPESAPSTSTPSVTPTANNNSNSSSFNSNSNNSNKSINNNPSNHARAGSLPQGDCVHVRANIVAALARATPPVRAQLVEALKRIVSTDFPLRFAFLVDHILHGLSQQTRPDHLHGALIALRALTKVYEFRGAARHSSARSPLPSLPPTPTTLPSSSSSPPALSAPALRLNPSQTSYPSASSSSSPPTQHYQQQQQQQESLMSSAPDLHFLHDNPRAALDRLVTLTFPHLLSLMRSLNARLDAAAANPPHPDDHAAREARDSSIALQRLVCKIFLSVMQMDMPYHLLSDLRGAFTDWMHVLLSILRRPVVQDTSSTSSSSSPSTPQPSSPPLSQDELRVMPQWKIKQRAALIVHRIFQRYGNPNRINTASHSRSSDEPMLVALSDFFRRTFAADFALAMLNIVSTPPQHISPRVANLALFYLETAVMTGVTYRVIKPALQPLIVDVIFPHLCMSDADFDLWQTDPVEYVRKSYDVLIDFYSPRHGACALLHTLTRCRRSSVLPPLTAFFSHILDEYAHAACNADPNLPTFARRKDGALLAIGTIRETLAQIPPNGPAQLNRLLAEHVAHEFYSPFPFLRARACWLYGTFAAAGRVPPQLLIPAMSGVQSCLVDAEFPVRVRAAVEIRHFLQNPDAADVLAPRLGDLLQLLFTLLDDIDSTDIVATIDQVAVGFSDRIAPFATQLCARLVHTFSRTGAGKGDEDAEYAATQCLQALSSIVTSVSVSTGDGKVALYAGMERTITEVFDHMFEERHIEHFEEALDLLAAFVYHSAEERGDHVRRAAAGRTPLHQLVLGLDGIGGAGTSIPNRGGSTSSTNGSIHGHNNGAAGPVRNPNDVYQALGQLGGNSGIYRDVELLTAVRGDVERDGGVISPYLWSLFPRALDAFHDWATDYAYHYLQVVDAYLAKSARTFVAMRGPRGERLVSEILRMVAKLWSGGESVEEEMIVHGSHVVGIFLQHCQRVADVRLQDDVVILTRMVMQRLRDGGEGARTERAVCALVRSLAHLTHVAAVTVLGVVEKAGGTGEVFGLWLQVAGGAQIGRRYDRKASAIGLTAIVGANWSQLPSGIRDAVPQIVVTVVGLLEALGDSERGRGGSGGGGSRGSGSARGNECGGTGTGSGRAKSATGELSPISEDGVAGRGAEIQDAEVGDALVGNGEIDEAGVIEVETDEMERAMESQRRADGASDSESGEEQEQDTRFGDDGDNAMFCMLHDVDELLLFESVVRRIPPSLWANVGAALSPRDAARTEAVLARASELRRVAI